MHFYFVYIHPFYDVNGRTSRTLSMWYLLNNKSYPFVVFNRAISFRKKEYYKYIEHTKESGDLTLFLKYMLTQVERELEKEYLIMMLKRNSGVTLSHEECQTIQYLLSMKGSIEEGNLTVKDLATIYNHFNKHQTVSEILAKRGIKFSHPLVAKRNLEGINYFFLKGYQKILLQSENTFKDNCDFTELTNLYFFDKELKALILEYLLDIEQKIKTAISNVISSTYGINDCIYLRRTNFDISNSHLDDILALARKQRQIYGKTNQAIKHYKEKYNYVPFYVLSKCLTFGTVKKIFNVMKQEDQIKVCNSILFCEINSRKISKVKLFYCINIRCKKYVCS